MGSRGAVRRVAAAGFYVFDAHLRDVDQLHQAACGNPWWQFGVISLRAHLRTLVTSLELGTNWCGGHRPETLFRQFFSDGHSSCTDFHGLGCPQRLCADTVQSQRRHAYFWPGVVFSVYSVPNRADTNGTVVG